MLGHTTLSKINNQITTNVIILNGNVILSKSERFLITNHRKDTNVLNIVLNNNCSVRFYYQDIHSTVIIVIVIVKICDKHLILN